MTSIVHITAAPEFARLILKVEIAGTGGGIKQIVVAGPGEDLRRLAEEGFEVAEVPIHRKLSPASDIVALFRLTGLLHRLQPDLVHTYTAKAGLLGQLAATLAGVPRQVHGCRGLLYRGRFPIWQKVLFALTDWLTCALADRVVFVSEADRAWLVGAGICAAGKAVHTGNGIDVGRFCPGAAKVGREEARAQFGFGPADTVVLTVGRFVEDKGYLDLIAAIGRMKEPLVNVRFLWIAPVLQGEGPSLNPDIVPERLRRVVTVLGRQEDMVRVYGCADLLVHPSHREGASRVLMEASAVGLPIVASDIPGNRAVVAFGRTAISYPVGDAAALGQAIDRFVRRPEALRSMALDGVIQSAERLNVSQVAARNWAVYQELGLPERGDETHAD